MNRLVKYEVNVKLGYFKFKYEFDDLRDADTFTYWHLNNLKDSDGEKVEVSIVPVLVPEQPEEVEADE